MRSLLSLTILLLLMPGNAIGEDDAKADEKKVIALVKEILGKDFTKEIDAAKADDEKVGTLIMQVLGKAFVEKIKDEPIDFGKSGSWVEDMAEDGIKEQLQRIKKNPKDKEAYSNLGFFLVFKSLAFQERTKAKEEPSKPFLGVPHNEVRKIGWNEPGSALRDVTKISAVMVSDYATYKIHKKGKSIVAEEVRGEFIFFAIEGWLHVPFPNGADASVIVTKRYKAKIPDKINSPQPTLPKRRFWRIRRRN